MRRLPKLDCGIFPYQLYEATVRCEYSACALEQRKPESIKLE